MENKQAPSTNRSSSQWTGLADVKNGFIYKINGDMISVLEVMPFNMSLKSQKELIRYQEALASAWNAEKQGFKILSIGRSVNLELYIKDLQEKIQYETSKTRKMLLQDMITFGNRMASSGEASERLYYIMLTEKFESSLKKTQKKLIDRRASFISNMNMANIECKICEDEKINNLFLLFTSEHVATEMPSDSDLLDIPLYIKGEE